LSENRTVLLIFKTFVWPTKMCLEHSVRLQQISLNGYHKNVNLSSLQSFEQPLLKNARKSPRTLLFSYHLTTAYTSFSFDVI
jgi:hypothetical protein